MAHEAWPASIDTMLRETVRHLLSDVRVRYGVEKAFRQDFVRPSHGRAEGALRTLIGRSVASCRLPGLALSGCSVPLHPRIHQHMSTMSTSKTRSASPEGVWTHRLE